MVQVFNWGVFECDLEHRRSVAVLSMLYNIRCNQMNPLCGALPGPYVLVWVKRGALVAYRHTFAPPRCKTLQYCITFVALSLFLWNDLADTVLDDVGLEGFKSRANVFLLT